MKMAASQNLMLTFSYLSLCKLLSLKVHACFRAKSELFLISDLAVASQRCLQTESVYTDGGSQQAYLEVGKNKGILDHRAVIPSYTFNCNEACGIISDWEIHVYNNISIDDERRRRQQEEPEGLKLSFDLQVLRPEPSSESLNDIDGGVCYRVVGNHSVGSCMLQRSGLHRITPSSKHSIPFQAGDVIGFYVKTTIGEYYDDDDSDMMPSRVGNLIIKRGTANEPTSESVGYAANHEPAMAIYQDGYCPYSTGRNGMLNCSLQAPLFISSK